MGYAEDAAASARTALGVKALPSLDGWLSGREDRIGRLSRLVAGRNMRLAQVGAWDVLTFWNPTADGWDPAVMGAWLTTAAATWAASFEDATAEAAAAALADTGAWEESLAAALAGWAATAGLYAQTIATEARSFGGQDAAGASGLTRKTWRTGGANPRTSHRAQDGETVSFGDVFSNGLRWPGDRGGTAAETAGCKCRLTYSREE